VRKIYFDYKVSEKMSESRRQIPIENKIEDTELPGFTLLGEAASSAAGHGARPGPAAVTSQDCRQLRNHPSDENPREKLPLYIRIKNNMKQAVQDENIATDGGEDCSSVHDWACAVVAGLQSPDGAEELEPLRKHFGQFLIKMLLDNPCFYVLHKFTKVLEDMPSAQIAVPAVGSLVLELSKCKCDDDSLMKMTITDLAAQDRFLNRCHNAFTDTHKAELQSTLLEQRIAAEEKLKAVMPRLPSTRLDFMEWMCAHEQEFRQKMKTASAERRCVSHRLHEDEDLPKPMCRLQPLGTGHQLKSIGIIRVFGGD
jgi:hypothetical protein